MFLKRILVVIVGVLLFIAAFFLKFHLSDQHLENTFQQERAKYGVENTVLTAPYASPPLPAASAAPDLTVTPASTAPAPDTNAPADASTSSTADEDKTPAPGTTADTNLIIGPVPPASSAAQDNSTPGSSAPAPAEPEATPEPPASAPAAPAADTNAGPMMPPASTSNEQPRSTASFVELASYRPAELGLEIANAAAAQTNMSTPAATNVAEKTSPQGGMNASATNAPGASASSSMARTNSASDQHAASAGGRAIVLGYHQFTGPGVPSKNIYSMSQDVFDKEMQYLRDNGFNVVPLSDVVRFVKGEIGLPPNAVAITIDDGYKSSIVYAAPVLKKYGYPWTFFVYPQFITRTEGKGAASWPDLVELGKEGVDVECHSMTHPLLSKKVQKWNGPRHLLTPDEYDQFLTSETSGAKAILEKELGKKIVYFAYPYGDYNKAVEAKVIAAGFEAVFTVADNPVHITTDVHSIGRYIITKPVEGLFAAYLRQGALSLAQVDPSPGATISDPRPVITATLGFNGDPASLETEVRDFGIVRHDFDPRTSKIRIYLQRDLVAPEVVVTVRDKDAQTGQVMVANWHFNYEPSGQASPAVHQPISAQPMTNAPASAKAGASETAASPKSSRRR